MNLIKTEDLVHYASLLELGAEDPEALMDFMLSDTESREELIRMFDDLTHVLHVLLVQRSMRGNN